MLYIDVKKGQFFVETKDPKKPRRIQRRIEILATSIYSAECKVVDGRGGGRVIWLPLKKITDPVQWSLVR